MSTREDIMGGEDDIMGAFSNFLQQRRQGGRGGFNFGGRGGRNPYAVQTQGPPPPPQLPGVTVTAGTVRSWAGLGVAQWTGADAAVKTLEIRPQETFQGKRLIFVQANSTGAAANIVSLTNLFVGSTPQSPVVDVPVSIAMFAADATDAGIDLIPCYRGQSITAQLSITAAAGSGESVTVVGGFYGDWIK